MSDRRTSSSASVGTEQATSPAELSPLGWRNVLRRTLRATLQDEMSLAAAGIAFYLVWALFPTLAVIAVLGAEVEGQRGALGLLAWMKARLPQSVAQVVLAQLDAIVQNVTAFSIAALFLASLLALWAGVRGARGLIAALNRIYGEDERRSVWHRNLLAAGLALLGAMFLLAALALIVDVATTTTVSAEPIGPALLAPSRWPALIVAMLLVLATIYRYAPCRRLAKWRWVTWGAAASATIWVIGSFAFSWCASHFSSVNPLLGSLGSIVIFLSWIYLTVRVVLLGAQINAQLEQQTSVDTTEGRPRAIGERGAHAADTVTRGRASKR